MRCRKFPVTDTRTACDAAGVTQTALIKLEHYQKQNETMIGRKVSTFLFRRDGGRMQPYQLLTVVTPYVAAWQF
jgi:hypothetical protein